MRRRKQKALIAVTCLVLTAMAGLWGLAALERHDTLPALPVIETLWFEPLVALCAVVVLVAIIALRR